MQARDFAKNQARYLAYRSRIDVSKGTREDTIRASMKRRSQLGKRFFDLALTVPGLVLLSPLITVAAVLAAIGVGWPILFRQQPPGLLGKPFVLVKFRTMTDARDANGTLKPDAARMPPIGRFLRMTSLDELPQLWNIIRGEMSLVGPRPLLMEYLPHYTAEQNRRHSVLPGITGWAQINGRNLASFSERLKLDTRYVDHWSLWLDVKILARTIINVLCSSGVKLEQPLEEVDDVGLHPDTRKKIHRCPMPGVTDI
jgi:lipopolysaccharide/colanic/teichoic acid biosynthesis glycosyltransferase